MRLVWNLEKLGWPEKKEKFEKAWEESQVFFVGCRASWNFLRF